MTAPHSLVSTADSAGTAPADTPARLPPAFPFPYVTPRRNWIWRFLRPLTRSIRRQLVILLSVIFLMLVILLGNALYGLQFSRQLVADLEFLLTEAPHRELVVDGIRDLMIPLAKQASTHTSPSFSAPHTPNEQNDRPTPEVQALLKKQQKINFARWQEREFALALERSRQQLSLFQQRLQKLPPTETVQTQNPFITTFMGNLWHAYDHIAKRQTQLGDPATRKAMADALLQELALLSLQAEQLPNPVDGLKSRLKDVRQTSSRLLIVVTVCSSVACILLVIVCLQAYQWILVPIRSLRSQATNVAYSPELRKKIKLTDPAEEMADLVEAINKVSDAYQEINEHLDQRVQEKTDELQRSERLAGIGFLAAGVAHEINNPLSAISMAAEALEYRSYEWKESLESQDADIIDQYLKMIQGESDRCREITQRLLAFARDEKTPPITTNLTTIVNDVIAMVRPLSQYRGREIEFDDSQIVEAVVRPGEMKQVVLNLLSNALEATDTKGRVSITLQDQPQHVRLKVKDNGCGMEPEILQKIFDPFFTRRRSGDGTGIGLSVTHRIVRDHGGRLEPFSDGPGTGSMFIVTLPKQPAT